MTSSNLNSPSNTDETILVVDDQAMQRKKMLLAVKNLGYRAVTAKDGVEALEMLRSNAIDLVLLDIVMPDIDGFEVMRQMNNDRHLREIPVIVVSSLDGEMESVVRAIEAGAQDFLRKNFDPVLLNARINASLEKKRNRDREIAYLDQVERLADAAAVLEQEVVDPVRFQFEDIDARTDSLGRLSRVFARMTAQVYERDRRLRGQIRALKGVFGLLAIGVISGLWAPLSRAVALVQPHPLGTAFWVNIVCGVVCIAIGAFRGKLFGLNANLLAVFALWGVLGTLLGEVVIFWAAEQLEAWIISLVVVTEGFMAFLLAMVFRIESPSMRRFLGFVIGVAGVFVLMSVTQNLEGEARWTWILIAVIGPLGYALRGLMLAKRLPENLDRITATGYSGFAAAIILVPLVVVFDDYYPLKFGVGSDFDKVSMIVVLLGLISAVACSLRVILIKYLGAVFASQSSIVVTVCGIGWGAVLLGERLPVVAWFALLLMLCGLFLVGPRKMDEDKTPIFPRIDEQTPGKMPSDKV